MLTIWIIHRDANRRAALARIAGAGDNTLIGHPSDDIFASAAPADAVVLAPSGDFELELQFAHRMAPRRSDSRWIILAEPADLAEARRLFDTLRAEFLPFPPTPIALRQRLQRALRHRSAEPLSARGGRERLTQRFSRWFRDMEEAPELLRALDPKLAPVPLLIRGEAGTGRSLLARYVHTFGGHPGSPLLHVACTGVERESDLLEQLGDGASGHPPTGPATIWLEDTDRLSARLQQRVQDWIDYGLPEGHTPSQSVRWIATVGQELAADLTPEDRAVLEADGALEPRLAQSLAGLSVAIAPLRERPEIIEPFLLETVARWCAAHGQRMRIFDPEAMEALRQHPWPGNLRELEAVVHRTLALTSADVLLPVHLRFEGETWRLDFFEADEAEVRQARAGAAREAGPQAGDYRPSEQEWPSPAEGTDNLLAHYDLPEDLPEDLQAGLPAGLPEDVQAGLPAGLADDLADDLAEHEVVGELIDGPATHSGFEVIEAEPLNGPSEPRATAPPSLPEAEAGADGGGDVEAERTDWPRLMNAIAHEVRNPLVSIRTFSELLPLHYEDEEFRTRFAELVGADVRRIEEVMDRLNALTRSTSGHREPVDIADLLDELLDEYADEIDDQGLEVLTELDASRSHVMVDAEPVRGAFQALFERALASALEESGLYVACKHHEWGLAGAPTVRVVLRFRSREEPLAGGPAFENESVRVEGTAPEEVDLAYALAEAIFRAQGGSLAIDDTLPGETLIAVDLPAASSEGESPPEG